MFFPMFHVPCACSFLVAQIQITFYYNSDVTDLIGYIYKSTHPSRIHQLRGNEQSRRNFLEEYPDYFAWGRCIKAKQCTGLENFDTNSV